MNLVSSIHRVDRQLVDVEVDYGDISGYFVKIDVELPAKLLTRDEGAGSVIGWLGLTADEADDLSELLRRRAAEVRQAAKPVR